LEVVRYAEDIGNRTSGRKFDAGETNVRLWSGEKEKLEVSSKKKYAFHSEKCKYSHERAELYQMFEYTEKWICSINGDAS
jgi:5-methylcytosine-specific restriction endonuclease McrBC regulatory subunit McrC